MRMIKLFAWESKTLEKIDDIRKKELELIMRNKLLQLAMFNIGALLPTISMVMALLAYVRMASCSGFERS